LQASGMFRDDEIRRVDSVDAKYQPAAFITMF